MGRAQERGFARDAVVYAAGIVLARLVSFLMLPIYTRYLSPADYGVLQVLQITIDVTAIALSAGLSSGVMRFYLKAETPAERDAVISSALLLLVALNSVGTLALLAFAAPVARIALTGAGDFGPTLVRIAATSFALEPLLTVPMLYLQVLRRPGWFLIASLAKLVLQLALNILLVVGFGWGPLGVLVGTLLATFVVGGALSVYTLRRTGLRFQREAVRSLRRFGVPYQIATAGTFILTFGDRFFLEHWHGLAAVGIYGLAHQFGFLLASLGPQPDFRAWAPQRLALATEPRPVRDADYARSFLRLNLVQILLAAAIALGIRPVLSVMSAPEFHGAAGLVPPILAAFVFQTWTDAVSLGIEVSEQTRYATFATWLSVLAILALYPILIPPFGGIGAALAMLLAAALRFGCTYHWSQKLWPVSWHWAPNLRLGGYAAACVIASEAIRPEGLVPQLGLGLGLGALLVAVVTLDPIGIEVRLFSARVIAWLRDRARAA
jgi:O-antigen/teichoic acid export membrane protein